MARYIRNPGGAVHSVTDEHYESLLEGDGDTDQRYLPHGYSEVKEAEARKAHGPLFGEPDPQVEAARVHLEDPNKGTSAADAEARINALVEEQVAAAVAAALAQK